MMDERVRPTNILGIPFSTMTMEETVILCGQLIRAGKAHASGELESRSAAGVCCQQVVTANPEIVMAARRDPALMEILHDASLVTCDGTGIVWASRYTARPAAERVAGYDLSLALLALAQGQGLSLYLLGSAPGVIDDAVANVGAAWPGLEIAGYHHGYFRQESKTEKSKTEKSKTGKNKAGIRDKTEEEIIKEIKDLRPDILLVGLGAPKQEFWINRHLEDLGVPLVMGVGGSLDVLAGAVKRAPVFWQKIHLEWLYRLIMQPSRWRRALAIPQYMALVFWEMILKRK